MKNITVFGLGWLGEPLAKALIEKGFNVIGTKTSGEGVEKMRAEGIPTALFNATENFYLKDPEVKALFESETQIITIPPEAHHSIKEYLPMIRAMVKTAIYCGVKRIIFTSSISVYGDNHGELIESSKRMPVRTRARALKALEDYLLGLKEIDIFVLRLGGLVGAGRHPIKSLSGRHDIPHPKHRVNLVHQADVIEAIMAIVSNEELPSAPYNIVAPLHPERKSYYEAKAAELNLTPPEFEEDEDVSSNKIINGDKITQETDFSYRYPDPATMPF